MAGGPTRVPIARRSTSVVTSRRESYVFDIRNGLRIWLSEAAKRGEVSMRDANETIARIDMHKAVDASFDYTKLLTGTVKDAFEMKGIGQKIAKDFGRWWHVEVYFKQGAKGDLVIFKGWPNGRSVITATRYAVDNVKMLEMQVGKPGIRAAARASAKFGVYLVVAVDLVQFVRDHNLAHFLAALTVDIPSVLISAAAGTIASSLLTGAFVAVGSVAMGPALIAFGVAAVVGIGLFALDKQFHLTEKVQECYERRLHSLEQWWERMGEKADRHWYDFVNSHFVHDAFEYFSGHMYSRISGPNASYAASRGWDF